MGQEKEKETDFVVAEGSTGWRRTVEEEGGGVKALKWRGWRRVRRREWGPA